MQNVFRDAASEPSYSRPVSLLFSPLCHDAKFNYKGKMGEILRRLFLAKNLSAALVIRRVNSVSFKGKSKTNIKTFLKIIKAMIETEDCNN